MFPTFPPDWTVALSSSPVISRYIALQPKLALEYATRTVFPPPPAILTAFEKTAYADCRVVIVGQDPYHQAHQAHGLAFSVHSHIPTPPSLRNILQEVRTDMGTTCHQTNDLSYWAEQGVLLLNSILTVREGQPSSHSAIGWEEITDEIIHVLSNQKDHIVFLLWGTFAQNKLPLIDRTKHSICLTSHPSPFSAYKGFVGCRHFSQCNQHLLAHHQKPIIW
jgi:uracil-DNA glycosylase